MEDSSLDSQNVTPKKERKRRDPSWVKPFLTAFANSGNVRYACQLAGITRKTVYQRRATHADFSVQYAEAEEDAIDALEAVAWQRGRESSDTLLIFLLKVRRYPETHIKHSITIDAVNRLLEDEIARIASGAEAASVAGSASAVLNHGGCASGQGRRPVLPDVACGNDPGPVASKDHDSGEEESSSPLFSPGG